MPTYATLSEPDKFFKLCAHFDNASEPERDNAIRAATRLLERDGLRWCQLGEVLSASASLQQPRTEPRPDRPAWYEPPPWRSLCRRLSEKQDRLTAWEKVFVSSLPRLRSLSTKQQKILNEIARRVLGAEHA